MIKNKIKNGERIDIPTFIVESLEENYYDEYQNRGRAIFHCTYDGFFENLKIWIEEEGVEKVVECGFELNREYTK